MATSKIEDAKDKLNDGARQAGKKIRAVAADVEDRYQKVAEEMRREADRAAERAREQIERAREQMEVARERMDLTVESVREGYERMRSDVEDLSEDVNEYVRQNPAKAILLSALIGFLVGLVFRGGSRD